MASIPILLTSEANVLINTIVSIYLKGTNYNHLLYYLIFRPRRQYKETDSEIWLLF
jgi:hypothetical protein